MLDSKKRFTDNTVNLDMYKTWNEMLTANN